MSPLTPVEQIARHLEQSSSHEHRGYQAPHAPGYLSRQETEMRKELYKVCVFGQGEQSRYERLTYLQPLLASDTNDAPVVKFEALARLRDKETEEIVPPYKFVSHLQDDPFLGLKHTIATTRDAIEMIGHFRRDGAVGSDFEGISINVSPHLLPRMKEFEDLLDEHDINPEDLTVEFTEDAPVDISDPEVEKTVGDLAERGVKFAADDVGAPKGVYALEDIPQLISEVPQIDYVKIDMTVLQRAFKGQEETVIIRRGQKNMMTLTEALRSIMRQGKCAVVEGVETEEQAQFVRQILQYEKWDSRRVLLQGFFRNGQPANYQETRRRMMS